MSTTNALPTLAELIKTLTTGEPVPISDDAPFWVEGVISKLDEETYDYWLEMLPPRWMRGSYFCFGEGSGTFRLFWKRSGNCYGRELSQAETEEFATIAKVRLHQ